jgi:hypothetical protein
MRDSPRLLGRIVEAEGAMDRRWFPRARAVGLQRVAAIPSHSFFGRVSIASVQLRLACELPVKQFRSLTEAAEWLSNPS